MKDYYKILGVSNQASEEEIKKAYRKLAHQFHPDKPGGDEKKFKEINEAYQVLSDNKKRTHYDRFGTADSAGQPGAAGGYGFDPNNPGFSWDFSGFDQGGVNFTDSGDLRDMFDSFFEDMGFRPKRKTYHRGSDLETSLNLTLEEAYHGKTEKISVKTLVRCASCTGTGAEKGAKLVTCATCGGQGEVREQRRTFFGQFSRVAACTTCHGYGTIPEKPCKACQGKGRIGGVKDVQVEIVPGIASEQIIKVAGAGEAGERGGEDGDLYVRVFIQKHPTFTRRNDDLTIEQSLNLFDVLLSRKIHVKTIAGKTVSFELPVGYNLKQPYRVVGEGMPRFGKKGHGDLLVDFTVVSPKKLNDKQKELLRDIEQS